MSPSPRAADAALGERLLYSRPMLDSAPDPVPDSAHVSAHAVLNLASLLKHDATLFEVSDEGLLLPEPELLEADGLRLGAPLAWALSVQNAGGDDDFILSGEVAGEVLMECRRCLSEVTVPSRSTLLYPMAYRPGRERLELLEREGEEDDLLVFGKPEVDFAELLTQLFAIDLPLTALCSEACRGLSPEGVNLNEHPEQAPAAPEPDKPSPFAALKDLEL